MLNILGHEVGPSLAQLPMTERQADRALGLKAGRFEPLGNYPLLRLVTSPFEHTPITWVVSLSRP
jgi:hypothetical protein